MYIEMMTVVTSLAVVTSMLSTWGNLQLFFLFWVSKLEAKFFYQVFVLHINVTLLGP